MVGGSPAETILGKNATKESIEAFNRKWGYDKPLVFARDSQFVHFLSSLAKGDLGYSIEMNEPVASVLARGVGPSLSLTVPILVGGSAVALMLAMAAAATRGTAVDSSILVGMIWLFAMYVSLYLYNYVIIGMMLIEDVCGSRYLANASRRRRMSLVPLRSRSQARAVSESSIRGSDYYLS